MSERILRLIALIMSLMLLTACADTDNGAENSLAESDSEASEQSAEPSNDAGASTAEAEYSYLFGLKDFVPSGGVLAINGVSITAEDESLKSRAEALFDKGNTKLALVLDTGFYIEGASPSVYSQSYSIEVSDIITVTASDEIGLYYGARTVSDYVKLQGCMEKGLYVDFPDVAERTLHFDIARKYYDKDFIIKMIQYAASCKLNAVQLHFSENEGFRIECETDPAIVSDEYLTKDEVREILAAAKEVYVEIIPSFDSPGHLLQVLKAHPEYCLTDVDGYTSPKTLDFTNAEAVSYIKSLLDEYAELFADCKHFNIGGDESFGWSNISRMQFSAWTVLENYAKATYGENANAHDAFVGYINDIAAYMRSKGFTVRAWNDGLRRTIGQAAVVQPDPDIGICYWSGNSTLCADGVDAFEEAGHTLYNVNENYMYYVLKEDFEQPNAKEIFENWNAGIFADSRDESAHPYDYGDRLGGAYFCIWCDKPDTQTQEEVLSGSAKAMAAMAVKAWNSEICILYRVFSSQYGKVLKPAA